MLYFIGMCVFLFIFIVKTTDYDNKMDLYPLSSV